MAAVALLSPSLEILPTYAQARGDSPPSVGPRAAHGGVEQTHVRHLVKNGREWLTLSLNSQAQHQDEVPQFSQGHALSGSVRLNLANDVVIRSISVSVVGELTSPAYYSRFLTITRQLFVSDANDLDTSLPDPPSIHEGKLKGEHSWTFLIRLPKGVSVTLSDDARYNFRLPPTLDSPATPSKAQIRYKVVARVKKGLLSSNTRIAADFIYTPHFRPSQPSIMRQIARLENQDPIGPEGDPQGWRSFDPIIFHGKVFNTRPVEATCILSVARPALDLLSSTSAPNVELTRHAFFSLYVSTTAIKLVDPNDTQHEVVGTAVWWPPQDNARNNNSTRILYGEIRVPSDAPPSCHIMSFQLLYTITLRTFKAVAFTPVGREHRKTSAHGLRFEPVEIVTVPAHAPLSMASSPPMYDGVSL